MKTLFEHINEAFINESDAAIKERNDEIREWVGKYSDDQINEVIAALKRHRFNDSELSKPTAQTKQQVHKKIRIKAGDFSRVIKAHTPSLTDKQVADIIEGIIFSSTSIEK